MRPGSFVALALVLGAPALAVASDAPHNLSAPNPINSVQCSNCHAMHNSSSAGLMLQSGNINNCASCHRSFSATVFGGDWGFDPALDGTSDQAIPGIKGQSHRWTAMSTNLGATPPDPVLASTMAKNLDQGKLMCSTCHDQHLGASQNKGPQHTSVPIVPTASVCIGGTSCIDRTGTPVGTGTLQLSSVASNAPPKGYLITITAANAQFKVSHDNGATFSSALPLTVGSENATDDAYVKVKFNSGGTGFLVGDTFQGFYVSYPFLITDNTDSAMCKICHKDRLMKYQDVEGGVANGVTGGDLGTVTLGQTVFHHPTSQTLNANLHGVDRTAAGILAADGSVQAVTTTDLNQTDRLVLGAGYTVHCMTCHQPHVADSNSLTIDQRTPIRTNDQ